VRHYTYWLTATVPVNGALNYIGKRSCHGNPDTDTYMSSSTSVKQAIAAGVTFDKKVLAEWDTAEEALSHEILLHEIFDVASNPLFFNKVRATSTKFAMPVGEPIPEERKSKISATLKGRARSQESIERQRLAQTGVKRGPMSEQHKQKVSAGKTGKKVAPNPEARRRAVANRMARGYTHSEETRKKISEALKQRNSLERSNGNTN